MQCNIISEVREPRFVTLIAVRCYLIRFLYFPTVHPTLSYPLRVKRRIIIGREILDGTRASRRDFFTLRLLKIHRSVSFQRKIH